MLDHLVVGSRERRAEPPSQLDQSQPGAFIALFDPERCQQGARHLGLRVKLDVDHGAVLVELKSGDRQTLIAAQPIQPLEPQQARIASSDGRRVFAVALAPGGLIGGRTRRLEARSLQRSATTALADIRPAERSARSIRRGVHQRV